MKSIFYCDVMGTYDSNDIYLEERKYLVMEFATLLSELNINEKIHFSFISTLPIEEVLKNIYELKKVLIDLNLKNVEFANQYGDGFSINIYTKEICKTKIGKSAQIEEDIKTNNYDTIYYADDSSINVKIAEYVVKRIDPNINVVTFIPNDLGSLCKLLKKHIKDKEHIKQKIAK